MTNINLGKDEELVVRNVPFCDIDEFLDPNGFLTRASYLYKIRDKNGKLKFYKPWLAQRVIDKVIREERKRTSEMYGYSMVQLMYLKARQEGLSTDTTLRITDKMIFNHSYYAQILAHDQEGTSLLYSQYERVYKHLPHLVQVVDENDQPITINGAPWQIPIKSAGGPTRKGIDFKDLTESKLWLQTAGKGDNAGKAGTINAVHFSEGANYESYEKTISSVNQQLGVDPQGLSPEELKQIDIFAAKESTANGTSGIGEGFYKDWTANEKAWMRYQSGENPTFEGWRPVFIPWYWLYHMPLQNGKKYSLDGIEWQSEKEKQDYLEWEDKVENHIIPKDEEIDENERDVKEYTNFYRWCIKNKCERKLDNARRYYPTNPEEAFTTSDKCWFNTNILMTVKTTFETTGDDLGGYKTGYLNEYGDFIEKNGGPLRIKKFPIEHYQNRYVVSCDQSKGYEDGDYSDMSVFDRLERDFVAYWQGLISEPDLARELNKLGYFFNNALLIPEENRATVINLVKPDGHERYMGELYYDKTAMTSRSRKEPRWGYNSNTASRKMMLDKYKEFLEGEEDFKHDAELLNYVTLFSEEMVNEHISFIREANGNTTKYEAAAGHKDDIVIGNALCLVGDAWWDKAPKLVSPKRRKKPGSRNISSRTNIRTVGSSRRQSQLGKNNGKTHRVIVGKKRGQASLGK